MELAAMCGHGAGKLILIWCVLLPVIVMAVVAWAYIFTKAGWPWAFCLLMIIPIANFIVLLTFGFTEWPILKELRWRRDQAARAGLQPPPGGSA